MYRFRHRRISLLLLPSAVRLATYSRVRSSQLIRPSASMCSARLASLLPPRLRRWRTVLPEEAGTGATPHRRAKDASLLSLSGLSPTATSREKPPCRYPRPERDEGGHSLRHQPPDLFVQLNDLLREPPMTTSNGPHR